MAILLKGCSGISVILEGKPEPLFFLVAKCAVCFVFSDILIHAFPAVFTFY